MKVTKKKRRTLGRNAVPPVLESLDKRNAMCCIKRGDGWRYNSHGRVYYRSLHHISQRSFSVLVSERLLLRGSSTRFTTRSRECSPRTGLPTKTQLLWLLFTIRVTIVRDSLRRIASSFTQYCFLASPMFSSE